MGPFTRDPSQLDPVAKAVLEKMQKKPTEPVKKEEKLEESKLDSVTAKEILAAHGGMNRDFHGLKSDHVAGLLTHAKKHGYRQPSHANGSRARYFHAHLHRIASKD